MMVSVERWSGSDDGVFCGGAGLPGLSGNACKRRGFPGRRTHTAPQLTCSAAYVKGNRKSVYWRY